MERRFAVHAGAREKVVLALALALAGTASAAPKSKAARAAFDLGVKAYQKKDFAAASEALGKSFGLEADPETLFAWAQSERQLDHCDKAIELYKRLLEMKLPDENRKAVAEKLDECKAIVAAQKPPPKDPEPAPKPAEPSPIEPAKPDPTAEKPMPDRDGVPVDRPAGHRPWFKQPIGDALVVTGAIGIGIGAYFLASARSADADAHNHPGSDVVLQRLDDKASSDGRTGMIAASVGGALVIAGIVYYATRSEPKTAVTGWLAPGAGGLAATGHF